MCLLLAKCNFLFERKGAVKLSIAFSDIKSLLKTIDRLSINESNVHNENLPSPQNVHVLIGNTLDKTKINIFSTVGPWELFRPFLLLRARKTDIRREPSYMCCVREVTSTHLGVEISVTQKVTKFKFPQPLQPHSPAQIQNNWVFHYMTTSPATPRTVPNSLGWSHALRSGFANRTTAPHKSTVTFYKNARELFLCMWVEKGGFLWSL